MVQQENAGEKSFRPVEEGEKLRQGDQLISRLVLETDRSMNYLHLKDLRHPLPSLWRPVQEENEPGT